MVPNSSHVEGSHLAHLSGKTRPGDHGSDTGPSGRPPSESLLRGEIHVKINDVLVKRCSINLDVNFAK